jgi:hypothetical protein
MSRHTTGIDVIDGGLRDSVRIVADIVLEVIVSFADAIGYDGAAIFQVDRVSPDGGRY